MANQTPKKMGRPTKYDPKYVGELIEFFESFVDEPFTKEVMREETTYYDNKGGSGIKSKRVEFKFVGKRLPTLFGFARKIGVNYVTVFNWANARIGPEPKDDEPDKRPFKYPDFLNAYKSRELYQTEFLTAVGLGGIAPPAAFVFTSKNILKWRDGDSNDKVDEKGRKVIPAYMLLPQRISEEEAEKEFEDQEPPAVDAAV